MTRPLGLLGAGRQAVESAAIARALSYEVVFYYEAGDFTQPGEDHKAPILRSADELARISDVRAITAVGSPKVRRQFVEGWKGHYVNLIDTDAVMLGRVNIGVGVTIAMGARVSNLVTIGSHVLINIGATVSHDVTIGDFATISPGVNVAGVCDIGAGSYVGIGAVIIDHIKIGEGALIAAGSVVTKDVEAGALVAGVPARKIRDLEDWA